MSRRFRGESIHKVDGKGRVSIPAAFRRVLEEHDPDYALGLNPNLIIISAKLYGKLSLKEEVQKKQKALIERKKKAQPSQIKTCGSTFKNTKNKKAWELIKESNCQDMKVGSAKISDKHCNFFINDGKATAKELEDLINKVKEKVYQKTKINLELEIKIIGYDI